MIAKYEIAAIINENNFTCLTANMIIHEHLIAMGKYSPFIIDLISHDSVPRIIRIGRLYYLDKVYLNAPSGVKRNHRCVHAASKRSY